MQVQKPLEWTKNARSLLWLARFSQSSKAEPSFGFKVYASFALLRLNRARTGLRRNH